MISAVLACDEKGGIGKDNTMPWPRNKEDMRYFKNLTVSRTIIMGSGTWNSIGMPNPLPNRINVVATTRPDAREIYPEADSFVPMTGMSMIESVRKFEEVAPNNEVVIIGGGKLIESLFDIIEVFNITVIPGDYDCDTFIPINKIHKYFFYTRGVDGESAKYLTYKRKQDWQARDTGQGL